jgi:alpha-galactosidase
VLLGRALPARRHAVMRLAACAAALAASASALDNGRGITPPRGWRSWDAFENSVNQTLQMRQVDMLVDRSRSVDGAATSLLDLGYNRIGLDDAWQDCGKGVNHSFHDPSGKPLIRPDRFPDMAAMNAYAKSKGIGSGWYLNTCDCCEKGALQPMWSAAGDAKAVKDLGFDGLKLDSCGPSQELGEWARLLNATGNHVLVENCFDNSSYPRTKSGVDDGEEAVAEEDCPMNMFRSGGDMRADWPLMLRRLQTIVPWLGLSRPKCWAYLDMLEVGNPPGGTGESPLFENPHSWRAHFGAWLINSSPLILSFDLANATKLNLTWDFITNREALKINSGKSSTNHLSIPISINIYVRATPDLILRSATYDPQLASVLPTALPSTRSACPCTALTLIFCYSALQTGRVVPAVS